MAQRKSAKMVRARERAQELAMADLERERELVEQAAQFLAQWEDIDRAEEHLEAEIEKIHAETRKKIDNARTKSQAKTRDARRSCALTVQRMLESGHPRKKIAERTGQSAAGLRRLLAELDTNAGAGVSPAPAGEPSPAPSGSSQTNATAGTVSEEG